MRLEAITVATARFDTHEVKPHFINPNCFGEDFARWLRQELQSLTGSGYQLSDPIQEDYGWGFWVTRGEDPVWISLSYCEEGPSDGPSEWVVGVDYDPGLNLVKRLFHRPDEAALRGLHARVLDVLSSAAGIRVVIEDGS
jgi:hypothetical protein